MLRPATLAALALASFCTGNVVRAQGISQYTLPPALTYPEGIALDSAGSNIYTVSAVDGTAVRTDVKSGKSEVIVKPGVIVPAGTTAFPAALGLKLDGGGRLWIAGGFTGTMTVVDTRTGTIVKRSATQKTPSLLNDVIVTPNAAYFVDTLHPVLWRVPIAGDRIGELEPWIDFAKSPIQFTEGANLNGIAMTPDGTFLLVVQMNKGLVYRIETTSRRITPVDLGGETVTGGDGLVLDGQTLYVVRQPDAEIVTVRMAADLSAGTVAGRFKNPALLWPATAAKLGDRLIVVNSQFNRRGTKDAVTPFNLAVVPLGLLQGK